MPCGYSSRKCDGWCAYKTPVVVNIMDWRLGLLKYIFMLAILCYVGVYNIAYNCAYLKIDAPVGTIRFSLQQPTQPDPRTGAPCDPTEPTCKDDFTPVEELAYCSQGAAGANQSYHTYPCVYWDNDQDIHPMDASVLLATRVVEYNQTRRCPTVQPAGVSCDQLWHNDAPNIRGVTKYVADINRFTLLLDHTVFAATINVEGFARNWQGHLKVTGDSLNWKQLCAGPDAVDSLDFVIAGGAPAKCFIKLNTTYDSYTHKPTGLDVVGMETLLQAAGIDLDATSPTNKRTIRYNGAILLLHIRYQNWQHLSGLAPDELRHAKGDTVPYIYEASALLDTAAKQEFLIWKDYPTQRTMINEHGIKIVVLMSGSLGEFNGAALLVAITSSLTLLAVSSTLVDLTATKLLPQKKFYQRFKYPETPHVSELAEAQEQQEEAESQLNQQIMSLATDSSYVQMGN